MRAPRALPDAAQHLGRERTRRRRQERVLLPRGRRDDPDNRSTEVGIRPISTSGRDGRILLMPRLRGSAKGELGSRMRDAFLRPAGGEPDVQSPPQTADEMRSAVRFADDKERLIGLIAAPWAAAIGILIGADLIAHDPAARLRDGLANPLHVSVGLYHEVLAALVVLSVVMLVTALLRKRLYLGIVMALYGLTVFNLHYWGFGVPFVMGGAWYLMRSYRLQRDLREATGGSPRRGRSQSQEVAIAGAGRARASKRYTPPASGRGR